VKVLLPVLISRLSAPRAFASGDADRAAARGKPAHGKIRESTVFWKTFGSPIATFGAGLCNLTVGVLAPFGVVGTNSETRRHTERNEELNRCWQRLISEAVDGVNAARRISIDARTCRSRQPPEER
jgi:hypothetical protein